MFKWHRPHRDRRWCPRIGLGMCGLLAIGIGVEIDMYGMRAVGYQRATVTIIGPHDGWNAMGDGKCSAAVGHVVITITTACRIA